METGSASARSRDRGPNPVEFKSKLQQKNYLKFTVPLHSISSFKGKETFFSISHKSFSLQKDFCVKYCYAFGFKQLNKRNTPITGFQVSVSGWGAYSSLQKLISDPSWNITCPFKKDSRVLHLISPNHHQLQQPTGSSLSTSSNFRPVTETGLLFISYMHRIKTRSINQLGSAASKQSPVPMILHHVNRNRKTGTQLPSVNFKSQKNNPLLKFWARTAEGTGRHWARSLNLHGKAHQHAEVTISQHSEPKGMCPGFSAALMQTLNHLWR